MKIRTSDELWTTSLWAATRPTSSNHFSVQRSTMRDYSCPSLTVCLPMPLLKHLIIYWRALLEFRISDWQWMYLRNRRRAPLCLCLPYLLWALFVLLWNRPWFGLSRDTDVFHIHFNCTFSVKKLKIRNVSLPFYHTVAWPAFIERFRES